MISDEIVPNLEAKRIFHAIRDKSETFGLQIYQKMPSGRSTGRPHPLHNRKRDILQLISSLIGNLIRLSGEFTNDD